jgi:hypothetical protein
MQSIFLRTGGYIRDTDMAPNACVGFRLAAFELVMGVKGTMALPFVAAEAEF